MNIILSVKLLICDLLLQNEKQVAKTIWILNKTLLNFQPCYDFGRAGHIMLYISCGKFILYNEIGNLTVQHQLQRKTLQRAKALGLL